ncbi:MAG TPA: LysR substrate-binding domain-containing protein [Jatrophihabitantaceae bacterium]|nr:LysR substrate-binding domain-containing protein [Jatrophihabitantaceae bacterium]
MQLNQLAYFAALADARHFTRAAEQMDVAQPTLSQQIRALEANLGTRLVVRRPGNIELTSAGEELLPIARRILAEVDNAHRALAELADVKRGRVRLGATPSLCTGLVPRLIADYHRDHPGVAIVITEGGSRDLQQRLAAGELDLALIVDSRPNEEHLLATAPLFVEELVVISSLDEPPPTRRARIGIPQLRTKQLVMFREGYDLRETTIAACREHGFEPQFAVEGGEMDAVLSLVAAGVGIAIVPSTVVGDRFRVTHLDSPGLTRAVQLSRRGGIELSRAALELERRVRTFVG